MKPNNIIKGKTAKIVAIAMLLASIYVGPTIAQIKTVTIDKKNITLNEFLSEIRKQTGFDFVFTSSKLDFNKKISPKFKDAQIMQVLGEYFNTKTGVIYVFKNQTIVLLDEDKADYRTIQGVILSEETKQPIVGATVSIAEKNIHTQTDSRGNFIFNVPEYAHNLIVSNVGYNKKVVDITPSINYKIELENKSESIDDIVVTGIFNRSAESFTGATRTISGSEIKRINPNSVLAAISAVDPSFRIVANNGAGADLNQMPEIKMRGENSFPNLSGELSNNPNQPLFVLDGFEVNLQRVVDLDMNLIKSITLLKDASATSLYGSRGASGVMVITTIPPAPGKIQVTLTNDFRLSQPELSVYNLLKSKDKLDFEKRAGVYSTTNGSAVQSRLDQLFNERYKLMLQGIETDWLSIPVQTGYSNRTSLRLDGGDQVFRYGVQFTGDLQEGVMKGQDRDNYSGQIDLTYLVNKIRFTNSLRVFQNNSNASPYGSFSEYVKLNPYDSPYDRNGILQQYLEDWTIDNARYSRLNPMYNASLNSINKSEYFGVTNNFSMRYNVLPFLYLESNFSISKQKENSDQFYSAQDNRFANITDVGRRGSYTAGNGNLFSYESMTTANFNLLRNKNLFVSGLGFNVGANKSDSYTMVAEGFPFDQLDHLLFASQYQQNSKPSGSENTTRRVGFLYNLNYSYDNRFLADFSIRRDGSSQYGVDKRFGTFWSTGIGWNIHNEQFVRKLGFVDRFRLRTTYGATGSLNIPAYAAQFRYNYGTNTSYYDQLGGVLGNIGNPDLGWQNVLKFNVGFDVSLFSETLDLTADLYRENTVDAVTRLSLAPSTGYEDYQENLGELENKGFEFSARYIIFRKPEKGLLWSVNVNGFTNNNILKSLSNALKAVNKDMNDANPNQLIPNMQLIEGQTVNTIYAVRSYGVDPITGSEVFLKKNGELTYVWDADDKVAVGIDQPKWNGNFGTSFSYKGFDLNLIFNYQFGGQIYNNTLRDRVESVNPNQNADVRAYTLGWSQPGDFSQYTRITTSSIPTKATSRFVQDESNLKLTSASFGYNLYRTDLIKKLGFRSCQLTFTINDIFWRSSVQIERGTDNPFARNYALSIRVGF